MAQRPTVVAFDIIGTVFSRESRRPAPARLGLPPRARDGLCTATRRDTFAHAATGGFAPFRAAPGACPDELLALQGVGADPGRKQAVPGDDGGPAAARPRRGSRAGRGSTGS